MATFSEPPFLGCASDAAGWPAGALLGAAASVQAQTYTTLDNPAGTGGTYAYGISGNNIVGWYANSSGWQLGFLYNGSTYTTLNDPLGVNGTYANGISGNNIVGYYYDSSSGVSWSGFEASVPEPSTLALSALGGLSLLLFRRRK